jgi:hypothetical protein
MFQIHIVCSQQYMNTYITICLWTYHVYIYIHIYIRVNKCIESYIYIHINVHRCMIDVAFGFLESHSITQIWHSETPMLVWTSLLARDGAGGIQKRCTRGLFRWLLQCLCLPSRNQRNMAMEKHTHFFTNGPDIQTGTEHVPYHCHVLVWVQQ